MLQLQAFTPADFQQFINWVDSPELLVTIAGVDFTYPLNKQQLQTYLNDTLQYPFKVILQPEGRAIGHAALFRAGPDLIKIDKVLLGDLAVRGKGLCPVLIHELLSYAFNELDAKTVELNVFDWNAAGIRCYEKCGFVMNPSSIKTFQTGDQEWTAVNMLIHKTEWEAQQAVNR